MFTAQLMQQEINGHTYGVGRCVVNVGGDRIDAVAVSNDFEKHITTRAGAVEWLRDRGLADPETFVRLGLQSWDEAQIILGAVSACGTP